MGIKFIVKQCHQKLIKHNGNINKVGDLLQLLILYKTTMYSASASTCQKFFKNGF